MGGDVQAPGLNLANEALAWAQGAAAGLPCQTRLARASAEPISRAGSVFFNRYSHMWQP
jgi:hypothetical protein